MTEESNGDPNAHGDKTLICRAGAEKLKNCWQHRYGDSSGLFQIRYLDPGSARSIMVDPETNIKRAAEMHKARGWNPWINSYKKAKNKGTLK